MEEEQNQQAKDSEVVSSASSGSSSMSSDDKGIALLSYLFLLCLVPLLTKKDSPFVQFHARQGLVLVVAWFVNWIIGIVPVIGWVVAFLGNLLLLGLSIMGIVNVVQGKKVELPFIGKYAKKINL